MSLYLMQHRAPPEWAPNDKAWIVEDGSDGEYLNVTIRVEQALRPATGQVERSIGIDLGLKDFAVTTDPRVIALKRHYRKLEAELVNA